MTNAVIETDNAEQAGPSEGSPSDPAEREASPSNRSDRSRGLHRILDWAGGRPASQYFTFAVVAACVGFVFWQLQPKYLLSDTIPSGGDMSAHVYGPAYLRDHLLPKGRLTGWSPDWYAGFPAFHFYMVIPMLAIALLSYVIPYSIAFKLVAVSGVVAMPAAAWLLGRNSRMPFPVPALLPIGSLFFLFDRSFSITGGNIASTLAGEFNYSISLTLGMFALAVIAGGLHTGKHRALAAVLLALCALCHPIAFFTIAVATVVWLIIHFSKSTVIYFATMGPVFVLLILWWFGPFKLRDGYLNDMGWNKNEKYIQYLFLRDNLDNNLTQYPSWPYIVALAVVGLVLSLILRVRGGVFLGLAATFTAIMFRFVPQGRLWNERLLPFYMLALYLLALTAIGLLLVVLHRVFADTDRKLARGIQMGGVSLVLLFSSLYIALPMHSLPFFGCEDSVMGTYRWDLGPIHLQSKDSSYLKSWSKWNFEGLEGYETTKAATCTEPESDTPPTYWRSYPEFQGLIETLKQVGREHGCGRAMWEYEEDLNRYGSTMEPMMLPHFTDGCIGSMEGLYFEASATTPYHFINGTQLSKQGSTAQRDLPYASGPPNVADFDQGVQHLQMLGVKYYMALDDILKGYAGAHPSLTKVADSGPWSIYDVAGTQLVAPMKYEPAVLTGESPVGHDWLETTKCWYVNPESWDVMLAGSGPDSWQKVSRTYHAPAEEPAQTQCSSPDGSDWGWYTDQPPAERELPPVEVTDIRAGDDSISFDVDRIGVPVLVRVSYFPNWKADGADGVHRVSPNLMVVVPTANHVELKYGHTSVEYVSYLFTLLGLVGLVLLIRAKPVTQSVPWKFWGRVERPDLYPPLWPETPTSTFTDEVGAITTYRVAPPPPGSMRPIVTTTGTHPVDATTETDTDGQPSGSAVASGGTELEPVVDATSVDGTEGERTDVAASAAEESERPAGDGP